MRPWVSSLPLLLCLLAGPALSAPTVERQGELINLLQQDCGSCHGLTLKGGLGPALLPQNLHDKSDAMLIGTILDGRPGTPMPPWNNELSRDEARWLVELLRKGVDNEH